MVSKLIIEGNMFGALSFKVLHDNGEFKLKLHAEQALDLIPIPQKSNLHARLYMLVYEEMQSENPRDVATFTSYDIHNLIFEWLMETNPQTISIITNLLRLEFVRVYLQGRSDRKKNKGDGDTHE